jgi:hypothetical protein
MIRSLFEFSNDGKKSLLALQFGRHYTDQSRVIKLFIAIMYKKYKKLVRKNLNWWIRTGFLENSAIAIERKAGVPIHTEDKRYALFIDCNCQQTCRPGGGPTQNGPKSDRFHNDVQRSFYNGWKSIHGLKHQTIDNAYGMTVDLYGPASLRRNDLELLRRSDLNDELYSACHLWNSPNYSMFGDSAYFEDSNLSTYKDDSQTWNRAMKTVRIEIEWNYGLTARLFPIVGNKQKLMVLKSRSVHYIYTVSTILRNFHACCYGNQTCMYFNLSLPENFLEMYMSQSF